MLQQKILQNCKKKIICLQKLFVSGLSKLKKEDVEIIDKTVKKKIPTYRKSTLVSSEIKNYLQDFKVDYLFDYIPKRLMRQNFKGRSSVYLVNPTVCKQLCSMIKKDLENNSPLVIECNPGLGILTQELLKLNVPTIHLYEKGETFHLPKHPLPILIEKYPKRLKLKVLDFFDIWLLLLRDQHFHESFANCYLDDVLQKQNWKDNPFMQIIAMCSDRKFLTLMVYNFAFQTQIFDNGRPEFYIALPKDVWERCLCLKESHRFYSPFQVFFNLFFNYKYYGDISRKAALPWPTRSSCTESINIPFSVVNVKPKVDTFDILEKDNLKAFWHFLKFGMRSRKLRVITEIENIIPGSGKELIKQDIDICTTFKELTPQKLLKLFKEFKLWPEYDMNLFKSDLVDEFKKEEEEETDNDVNNEGNE